MRGQPRRPTRQVSSRSVKLRANARHVIFTSARPKPSLARDPTARQSCWWANNRETTKMSPANRSSGQRKIMDQALEEAGIDRSDVYVTNAVKHFKWEPRGKRRIHKKPNSREIAACRPWLEAELRLVKPTLLVCLGATAAQAIFGPSFRVTRERGKVLSSKFAPKVLATVHPSSLLRQPDEESRQREYKRFVLDLRAAVRAAREE